MTGSRKRVLVIGRLVLALILAMSVATLGVVRLAHAASFAVTDCSQEGTATTAGTIAKAIADATSDAGTSESISFNCGSGTHTIPFWEPLGTISARGQSLIIDGGGEQITLDGGGAVQIFQFDCPLPPGSTPMNITLEHLTLTNGSAPGVRAQGGAITDSGCNLALSNDTLANSVAATTLSGTGGEGGALYVGSGDLSLSQDTFTNDTATTNATSYQHAEGGALYMVGGGNLSVQNSNFDHDSATSSNTYGTNDGGAIYYGGGDGTLSINGSTFTNDSAKGIENASGGAVYNAGSSAGISSGISSITDSNFDHDSATAVGAGAPYGGSATGGAIENNGTLDTVSGDIFTYDSATGTSALNAGGAVENTGRITMLSGGTFDHDSVTDTSSGGLDVAFGGALASPGTITTLATSNFTYNSASGPNASGGAVAGPISGTLGGISTISRSSFVGNAVDDDKLGTTNYGGAFAIFAGNALTIANSSFAANSATASSAAPAYGGAIFDGTSPFPESSPGAVGAYRGATFEGDSSTAPVSLVNDTLGGDSVTATGSGTSGGELYVAAGSTGTVSNSILANGIVNGAPNNCAGGPAVATSPTVAGIVTNIGYNVDSGSSCNFGSANHSMSNTDPMLGTPASFSGSTLTYTVQPSSPAIEAGNDSVCAAAPVSGIDQRGETRPQGAHCDIGAYEFALFTTTTTLSASPSTQAQGQPAQLCATVTPASGTPASLGTPSGTITFYDGSTPIGTATLGIGKGCFSTSSLSLGSHNNLTAKYGGDPSFQGSTSAPASVFIGVVGNGGAASGAQPVSPQNPTGGPVTSTGSSNSSSGTANNKSTTKTANSTSTQRGLPGWLLVLLILVVLAGGAAGGTFYLRQRGLLSRLRAR